MFLNSVREINFYAETDNDIAFSSRSVIEISLTVSRRIWSETLENVNDIYRYIRRNEISLYYSRDLIDNEIPCVICNIM